MAAKKAPSSNSLGIVNKHGLLMTQNRVLPIVSGPSTTTMLAGPYLFPPAIPPDKPQFESEDDFEDYIKMARQTGIINMAFISELFLQVFAENEYKIHNPLRVVRYMDEHYGNGWDTYPVREIDREISQKELNAHQHNVDTFLLSNTCFHEIIPITVLEKIDTIASAIPESRFFVLSGKADNDHFLMATTVQCVPLFVVAHWREPKFME